MGIAIAIQRPEFCYSMAGFDKLTILNGTRLNLGMHCSIPFEREYHPGQCKLLENSGRPGLVELLGGGQRVFIVLPAGWSITALRRREWRPR